ncbi:MAG: hypothetical protein FJZ92_05445 [Chloroflexi bacterium]|nr:hypothetical protein [Chloroflexota bacterium]
MGWFAIVGGFPLGLRVGWRLVARARPAAVRAIEAMLVAFAVGVVVMMAAGWWVARAQLVGAIDARVLVVLLWIALAALVIGREFPFRHDAATDVFVPAVPLGLQALYFLFVLQARTYADRPDLLLTIPLTAAVTAVAYGWPYLDRALAWRSAARPERG